MPSRLEVSGQSRPQEALAPFENETSVSASYEHRELSDACSTGTPARWCPPRARVPVLQVTALSDAVSYTFPLPNEVSA